MSQHPRLLTDVIDGICVIDRTHVRFSLTHPKGSIATWDFSQITGNKTHLMRAFVLIGAEPSQIRNDRFDTATFQTIKTWLAPQISSGEIVE